MHKVFGHVIGGTWFDKITKVALEGPRGRVCGIGGRYVISKATHAINRRNIKFHDNAKSKASFLRDETQRLGKLYYFTQRTAWAKNGVYQAISAQRMRRELIHNHYQIKINEKQQRSKVTLS